MTNQTHNDEAERAAASARLEGIITSAMDAIISIDESQKIILFNPGAERMFLMSAQDALGSDINRFIPQRFRDAHPGQVRQFGATGATHRRMGRLGAVRGLRANGEEFPAEASISQIDTQNGRIYTVIMRDISERQAAEEALRRAHEDLESLVEERTARLRETINELEHMSYSITHDMRAPLRAIQSFAGILEQEASANLTDQHKQYLTMMKAAASRMDALIRDVLTYGSIVRKEVPLEPVDVVALVRSVVQTYPAFRPPLAEVDVDSDIPPVMGNIAMLTQCVSNLMGNAIKFVKPGEIPKIRVFGRRNGDSVRLSFRDNGVGISPVFHTKIFGMFQRLSTGHEGTGIGLAVVKKAVERMGGTVSVESSEGQGSTFHLDLNAAQN